MASQLSPMTSSLDSFNCFSTIAVDSVDYGYFDLKKAEQNGLKGISRLPFSLRVLLENLLRCEDGNAVKKEDILAFSRWLQTGSLAHEIAFHPARVLMQDFTGVPAIVDLAAMRDAAVRLGADAGVVNPLVPVDLVIDHSVKVDYFATPDAFARNVAMEYERNLERYVFLRWGQSAFANLKVVPPGTGICHQVNLEHLAKTVWADTTKNGTVLYPDTVVGTDSHTTMINALSVLGWGVGGIEAEAVMLNQPISMLIPDVIGVHISGAMARGVTATDIVLTITQMLRREGVVGKFVEYFGSGLANLTLEDRATIANMAPEYGATCGFFPIDKKTIDYLDITGRGSRQVSIVESYAKQQGLFYDQDDESVHTPVYTRTLDLDLSTVVPSIAGPKRPQDKINLDVAASSFNRVLADEFNVRDIASGHKVADKDFSLNHGDVVIAAITSCTNTSNPALMVAAGLVARNANRLGLKTKPWVKTSFAPGSQVVSDYLQSAGLQKELDAAGFNLVGYGCTTCIGNSGPLAPEIVQAITDGDLVACAVLSGNRNFEGRVNPNVKANFLASPPLVVAYALAGSMRTDIWRDPIGKSDDGEDIYLKDIWPPAHEINDIISASVNSRMFARNYAEVFTGDDNWRKIAVTGGDTYNWDNASTYIQNPPFFSDISPDVNPRTDINNARILALFLDSITTDHISPAGFIKSDSPTGKYLMDHGVDWPEFNSYGARRGNHEVMMRGTFANIRIKNQMVPGVEGGVTIHHPSQQQMPIYDAAMLYQQENVPLVVFAGQEYGTGSSRDWAAKGTRLLGVRAVIAGSFERIHRSNLIGMGVLPLVFKDDTTWQSLGLTGSEQVSISGINDITVNCQLMADIRFADGKVKHVPLTVRIDTDNELAYFRNDGILSYVLRNLIND